MVSTSSTAIEQVRDLFRRCIGLTKDLVGDLDAAESELQERSIELFKLAVKAVIPVLKYVDEEISLFVGAVDSREFRGVHLARGLCLTREGNLLKEGFSGPKPIDEFWFYGSAEDTVDAVLEHLTKLAKIFNDALLKMDRRRESIQDRRRKLDEAIAPFRRDASS